MRLRVRIPLVKPTVMEPSEMSPTLLRRSLRDPRRVGTPMSLAACLTSEPPLPVGTPDDVRRPGSHCHAR